MGQILALLLAFNMPIYHLVYIQGDKVVERVEDLTGPECKAKQIRYKPRAQAQCVLIIGEREYT